MVVLGMVWGMKSHICQPVALIDAEELIREGVVERKIREQKKKKKENIE